MSRTRKQIIADNAISELYTFTLGGVPQKVLAEGKQKELPVVITLHGGPGSPIPFSVGCRGMFPEFTDRFIMIYWDQLGCGINDCKLKDNYAISNFVQMTNDLIAEIRKLFPKNRIILFGMSWGSVLALKCSRNADAVVVWGQVLHSLFLNDIVYEALAKAGIPAGKLRRIKTVTTDNFTDSDMKLISNSIRKYTDGYINKNGKQPSMVPIIKGLLTSPDYSFRNFKAIMVNGTASSTRIWPELLKTDLTEELARVQVPYHILQGDTDIVTPTEYAVRVIKNAGNRCLSLRIAENSGHMPGEEGMRAVFDALLCAAEEQEQELCQK